MVRRAVFSLVLITSLVAAAGCRSGVARREPEARSLTGAALHRPAIDPARERELVASLRAAEQAYEAAPGDEEATIWYGRRLAYLGRYREAIGVFSRGLETHPRSYRLLRHRGHRHITVRQFDRAVADLTAAARLIQGVPDEIEPDGAPNARNIPRSTTNSNIHYHLGLAHYLRGDFASAADAFGDCLEFSRVNDDMLVATSYWLLLSRLRSGRSGSAVLEVVHPSMEVIENHDYHRLLLLWKGDLTEGRLREDSAGGAVSDATIGYGIGVWKLLNADVGAARAEFTKVVRGPNWAAFGFIAAEAELAR